MYYKVIRNGKVVDVLDRLLFVKYQQRNEVMLLCRQNEAQAVLSSDNSRFWHIDWMFRIPEGCCAEWDEAELEEIDKYEYEKLKMLNLKTPEEIIDEYTLQLIDGGLL